MNKLNRILQTFVMVEIALAVAFLKLFGLLRCSTVWAIAAGGAISVLTIGIWEAVGWVNEKLDATGSQKTQREI